MKSMDPIATSEFVAGPMRPVYEEHERQFVIDDEGNRTFGV